MGLYLGLYPTRWKRFVAICGLYQAGCLEAFQWRDPEHLQLFSDHPSVLKGPSFSTTDPVQQCNSPSWYIFRSTLWLFNIAMENGPFIDGLPIENGDFPWLC
jgi:hypothetical protein